MELIKTKMFLLIFQNKRRYIYDVWFKFLDILLLAFLTDRRPEYKGEKSATAKTQLWGIFDSKGETTSLIIELALHSLCHPAGNRQDNNKLITVDTRADYTLLYPSFTQTLDKPVPSNPEKQIMWDSIIPLIYWPFEPAKQQ